MLCWIRGNRRAGVWLACRQWGPSLIWPYGQGARAAWNYESRIEPNPIYRLARLQFHAAPVPSRSFLVSW